MAYNELTSFSFIFSYNLHSFFYKTVLCMLSCFTEQCNWSWFTGKKGFPWFYELDSFMLCFFVPLRPCEITEEFADPYRDSYAQSWLATL